MAFVLADRVREFTTTSGTGQIFLGGAAVGFRTFSDGIGNGNSTFYAISVPGGAEWEVGIGTVGVGTLTRDTVLASSNGGSLVNFAAGTKDVFATYAGAGAVMGVGGNILAPAGTRLPVEHGGTGVTSAEGEVSRLAAATNKSELLTGLTTADLAESPSNLYYTNARVDARIASEVPTATTSTAGKVELATSAETQTGTNATKAVTPAAFTAALQHTSNAATETRQGTVRLAGLADALSLTENTRAITASTLGIGLQASAANATTSQRGTVELATNAETATGTDTTRAVTPAGLAAARPALDYMRLGAFTTTGGQPVADSTYTRVSLTAIRHSGGDMTRSGSRIVVPVTGVYLLNARMGIDTGTHGMAVVCFFEIGGSERERGWQQNSSVNAALPQLVSGTFSMVAPLAAGTTVGLIAFVLGAGMTVVRSQNELWLEVVRLA